MKGHKLATVLNEHDQNTFYWTDGKTVYFRIYEIKGANIESFEQFSGSWAKDKKHCYLTSTSLQGADPETFEVLNFAYAKDKSNVWTMGGRIPEADSDTFEVCDSGKKSLGRNFDKKQKIWYELFVPYGFGKDKNNVYYYDYQGKTKIVKKGIPSSFQSLGDGKFSYDEKSVFCGHSVIPKANPATWKKLHNDYYYSKDQNRIYYFNRLIKEADAETFEVVVLPVATGLPYQYARDKNFGYWNDHAHSLEEFENMIRKELEHYEKWKEKIKQYLETE